jgi:phosphoglycolate phosphatase
MRRLILFDFDGTLADTAPDLAFAANLQRERLGLPALPYEQLRPQASHGARGLLGVALGLTPADASYESHRLQFLRDYEQYMMRESALFPGVSELLSTLSGHGHAWGIVTNKVEYLARPIIRHLGLEARSAAIVGGDTAGHPKPHPAPLLHAARQAGFAPADCVYVGDDERDIIAGKAAGMPTIAVSYGYCDPALVPAWGADAVAASPAAIWPAVQAL